VKVIGLKAVEAEWVGKREAISYFSQRRDELKLA